MNLELLLENFNNSINVYAFLFNLVVATVLSVLLGQFYIRFGNAVANRQKFAANFIPLALTTVLIITIIKTSIALSLGLVGALSIVRFRAAIKDPEELIYLFLVIAIGLATGADYPILASVAVGFILVLLFINYQIQDRSKFAKQNMLYVNIASETTNIEAFLAILRENMDYVELKRMDRMPSGVDLTFICKAASLDNITAMQEQIITSTPNTTVSIVDQPDLIV
ncbi:MAG: Unknown protein [uncultured Aureispira sp.]|uniref:DUF4956 domain-containing protein n=1 Tax=uncultured Aureispira sp. TaxID=1331704 RepID=A0A6S6SVF3_9BACT|nr:MAG: Unknown protein [uncultured Aureispira sp.]